jgi:iron-sulfur cluster repair protein YtfE (RIC family)
MHEQSVQVSYAEDHDRLDQLLAVYRELKGVDFPRAKQAFKDFKTGLQRHILWEEGILFPLVEEKTGMRDSGPTAVMRAEHREIGRRLEAVHDKVRARDPDSDREVEALLEALNAHNQKEEKVLYPAIDRLATEQEKAAVFRRMAELPEEAYQTCCAEPAGHVRGSS